MRKPRTYREHVVAHVKQDIDRIRFSIGSGWEHWSSDDVLKVLKACGEIEKIVNSPSSCARISGGLGVNGGNHERV